MKDSHETPPTTVKAEKRPVLTVAAILYATLILVAVAIPVSVTGWVRDLKPGPVQEALLPAAETLERTSKALSLEAPYQYVRSRFLQWTGKTDQ